jgi:TIR domain
MAYDVFLVSAKEDSDVAKLIVRRLRALKFKVWFDQKYEDETFDAKEAKAAIDSQTMLVLWSANAIKSDWVRAAASVGHSRAGTLLQVGLDRTVPYEPFKADKRQLIEGMTSRKTPEGFYVVVEELGRRDGRTDLRTWLNFGAKDDDKRAAWLTSHPTDPLAREEKKKQDRASGIAPLKAGKAAAGAAAGVSASARGPITTGAFDTSNDDDDTIEPDDDNVRRIGTYGKGAATLTPAAGYAPSLRSAPMPPSALTSARPAAQAANYADDGVGVGNGTMLGVLAALGLMLFFGWFFRAEPMPGQAVGSVPAIANSKFAMCPEGQLPRSYFDTLEPGPIIDDTK